MQESLGHLGNENMHHCVRCHEVFSLIITTAESASSLRVDRQATTSAADVIGYVLTENTQHINLHPDRFSTNTYLRHDSLISS